MTDQPHARGQRSAHGEATAEEMTVCSPYFPPPAEGFCLKLAERLDLDDDATRPPPTPPKYGRQPSPKAGTGPAAANLKRPRITEERLRKLLVLPDVLRYLEEAPPPRENDGDDRTMAERCGTAIDVLHAQVVLDLKRQRQRHDEGRHRANRIKVRTDAKHEAVHDALEHALARLEALEADRPSPPAEGCDGAPARVEAQRVRDLAAKLRENERRLASKSARMATEADHHQEGLQTAERLLEFCTVAITSDPALAIPPP